MKNFGGFMSKYENSTLLNELTIIEELEEKLAPSGSVAVDEG